MNKAFATALLALSALLAGCPESVHPLSDPASAAPDPAVFGVWRSVGSGEETWLHIAPAARGMTSVVMITHGRGGLEMHLYTVFPTRLGKLAMANLDSTDRSDGQHSYLFARYEVKGEKLTVRLLSVDAVNDAVKAGRLQGRTEHGAIGDVLITAPGEAIVRWLESGKPEALFGKPATYRRVEGAEPQHRRDDQAGIPSGPRAG